MTQNYDNLYQALAHVAETLPNKVSFRKRKSAKEFPGISFGDLKQFVDHLSLGFIELGVEVGDRIGFFCDATVNWLRTDFAILTSGAVVVPRGTDIVREEILYILNHSEAKFLVVQKPKDKKRIDDLLGELPHLKQIFILETDQGDLYEGENSILSIAEKGKEKWGRNGKQTLEDRIRQTDPDALATLIYTSGTTGNPKGVMLSQKGWITAIQNTISRLDMNSNDNAVSLLPPWHAFERAIEYAGIFLGIDFLVSNMSSLKDDLRDFRPTIFPSVPRIWESVYNGIIAKVAKEGGFKEKLFHFFLRFGSTWAHYYAMCFGFEFEIKKPNIIVSVAKRTYAFLILVFLFPLKLVSIQIFSAIHKALGGRIRICISAGSALPSVVDGFLSAIGLKVLEGYGMTETSAVVSIRSNTKPTKGTVGIPIAGYQIRLKDETGKILTDVGAKGTLWIKSKQILKGYYKRPELNQVVFDAEGFFDTGDLMMISHRNELVFAGRSKDTIALIGGENVEPIPIEDKLLTSSFIDQVMVVGHDKKTLGALIVPNFEAVETKIPGLSKEQAGEWNTNPKVRELYRAEISRIISRENGFKGFEMIPANNFYVVPRPFDPDVEMTRTLKMKRNVISDVFSKQIEGIYQ
ncbi:long-chain fatty acid--CoA ligase [Leptospira bourretii]|uniref:Long-chain fatty acid--CoA ligase n=1 Tax=Leptospira bourretii TaxID=2484962 RepID=A0A4R9ILW1_9LEPT|nr:long-chain fatty acid--CoA ligase [Leptospira bourretii]TGK85221.1 long-chain fatty acid--CoA ligase [Leptospira bourretii]TGK90983.1 long-chain fatty acid--CoA ligase [Leptospira bourretii]TGL35647.1 long-chain fatty acid--CoA ligase [Leptospira bourretii]